MFFADWPMVMFSRLRTSRSSTIRPPWMMPMRRIFELRTATWNRLSGRCLGRHASSSRAIQKGECETLSRILGMKSCFSSCQS